MRRIGRLDDGTPAFWAENDVEALSALGTLHGRYRPLQSLLITTAGLSRLSSAIWPAPQLMRLDEIGLGLDLANRAAREDRRLSPFAKERLDAYVRGLVEGLAAARLHLAPSTILFSCPRPTRPSIIAGFILSAYLGLAESQARMEKALIEIVRAGANPRLLEEMFSPHLEGWDTSSVEKLETGPGLWRSGSSGCLTGGSNAWAVDGTKTRNGRPILAGDPHLQINQIPSLFFEVSGRVGHDYWLGATIPGLPGLAVGRNRHVAWSGTFAVADNVDHFVEEIEGATSREPDGTRRALSVRREVLGRRFRSARTIEFLETSRGVLERDDRGRVLGGSDRGRALSTAWAGGDDAADAIDAYLRLPSARAASEADDILARAHTLSLHFVLADRGGEVRYRQVGRIPWRSGGWSGLCPADASGRREWVGVYTGADLPRQGAQQGFVASANEARLAPDGGVLATLAQPEYRLRRIEDELRRRNDHDVESMKTLQCDTLSLQGKRIRGTLVPLLLDGPLKDAIVAWDLRCEPDSVGAHAFALARDSAVRSLAGELGGEAFTALLDHSEIGVWWCAAIDRVLARPEEIVAPDLARRLVSALAAAMEKGSHRTPEAWGEVQRFELSHLVLGALPGGLGASRGPFPLRGSTATVWQGTKVPLPWGEVAVGPAYRFVTDLGSDEAHTSIPGGIDGSFFSSGYDRWLEDHLAGRYHRLLPPTEAPGA